MTLSLTSQNLLHLYGYPPSKKISIPLLSEPGVVHMFDQTSMGARNKAPCRASLEILQVHQQRTLSFLQVVFSRTVWKPNVLWLG